ncbi:MAG: M28 family peptidase [Planctomycetes bacterium]|nr:M28 family peptidase [Planctomycetota bacterium]
MYDSHVRRGASMRGAVAGALTIMAVMPQTSATAESDPPPLLPRETVAAIANELSGTNAKEIVQELSRFHRMRGSRGFRSAAEAMRDRAIRYGLAQVEIIELPADGKIFYGTQRSRPAWDAEFAELWELRQTDGEWKPAERIASWNARPVTLAQDSASGQALADLIDVGQGTSEADYDGKDVRGKLVLAAAQPGPVSELAVDRFGAAGIVSYAQNQRSAWWREDETLVRWGHLNTFPEPKTFAFMVSLKQARTWQERLARGETVRLSAVVRAGQHPGSYDIATAVLPGRDAALAGEEIVFSCHLDHLRPGANDNASGAATILEVARTLAKLTRDGTLPRPRRSIRFIWPAEIEGTIALLNARPEFARRAKAVIHMDMVGGDAEITKAVFHVTRSPKSLPTFVNDVAEAFGRFVNEQSYEFAASGRADFPLVDPEGGKEALLARMADFSHGSDHEVWTEGSFRVPAIYLNDWPDRYIHTHADRVDNIDPTKLKRAAFIGAASAYYLANLDIEQVPDLWNVIRAHALERTAVAVRRAEALASEAPTEAANLRRFHLAYERRVVESITRFAALPPQVRGEAAAFFTQLQGLIARDADGLSNSADHPDGNRVYQRRPDPKGTMSGFGYSYFNDHLKRNQLERPKLLSHAGRWGGGSAYAYEALNLVDGRRTVQEIRDDLSAIYGPVPLDFVAEHLRVLERIGILGVGSDETASSVEPAANQANAASANADRKPELMSLLGRPLYAHAPGSKPRLEAQLVEARGLLASNTSVQNLVWLGRRHGYLWRMTQAITMYTAALQAHPDYAPLYRHRGHRYISLRQFDKAIADLERAAELIRGKPDEIEPDGMPNEQNIPLTTTAFNVWYHLGLARFLKGDFEGALQAYEENMNHSRRFDDNLVSTSYWMYLTLRRLGRDPAAAKLLEPIKPEMDIIENHAYHRLLLLFKNELKPEQVLDPASASPLDFATSGYGVGCWHTFQGQADRARQFFEKVVATDYWPAFGFIAAEVELARQRQ